MPQLFTRGSWYFASTNPLNEQRSAATGSSITKNKWMIPNWRAMHSWVEKKLGLSIWEYELIHWEPAQKGRRPRRPSSVDDDPRSHVVVLMGLTSRHLEIAAFVDFAPSYIPNFHPWSCSPSLILLKLQICSVGFGSPWGLPNTEQKNAEKTTLCSRGKHLDVPLLATGFGAGSILFDRLGWRFFDVCVFSQWKMHYLILLGESIGHILYEWGVLKHIVAGMSKGMI